MAQQKTIESKELRTFAATTKRETRLMGAVERHVLAKPFDERNMGVIHPSDIIKPEWCALAQYHALQGNYKEVRDKPGLRLASIFAEGHTIHAKWQSWLKEMGVLYGKWYDTKTKDYTWATSKDLVGYPSNSIEYKEVPLHSSKHMISGHADGWVKGLGEDFLIEIKSIGAGSIRFEAPRLLTEANNDIEKAWRNIRQPFPAHMLQGQMYLHLCHLMAEAGELQAAPKEIVFIYELKANQDYKEFVVTYNYDYVKEFFDKALDVAWAVENNRPPLCSIDPVKGCERCEPFKEDANVNL